MDVMHVEAEDAVGDRECFELLYRHHHAELLRYAARRVDLESAHEIVADTFVVVWRRIDDVPTDQPRAWLFGVARRVLSNELRSEDRRRRLADRVRATTPAHVLEVADVAQYIADRDTVQSLLASLPPAEREALELTEWDGLSPSEAAHVVGCSAGAFRVRLYRARRHLIALHLRTVPAVRSADPPRTAVIPMRSQEDGK
jgi:RNA polymerase sigma-70 factor (ECF subfamily)